MIKTSTAQIAVMGIDIGKNSFHVVGPDKKGAIVLRQKWSRGQIEARLANLAPCLVGIEACNALITWRKNLLGLVTMRG
jgi:transposase